MAVPEGYTEVGLIGLVNKGNYDPLTEYSKYNFVYYQGSTYLYINELPQSGVTPSDDGVTWQYMSRGMIMDNTPTQGSPNAVTSGGIYDSERALKTEIQNEQTAATTKATDTNNVLGQGTVTNATNVQALLDNVTDKDTNPTKDSAKTVTSGGVYSADKATREMIAPVEENAVSSAPYAIGEQLIFNGVLCEVTSAISIGDTLAMGTNLSTANKITNRDSTPTANSTKLVTSGGVYSADNQIRENIANVEGATSAHPYAVGKQLIFNGLLCKATSAISVGDTLAVGTNLALSDNVVEQIYSLNQGLTNSLNEIADMNNVLGAKNLLPTTESSHTYSDVDFAVNSDGTITATGTPSGWGIFPICLDVLLKKGSYIINGTNIDSIDKAHIKLQKVSDSSDIIFQYSGDISFTLNQDTHIKAYACVGTEAGSNVNITFKPMLRLASIQDNTYVPYSMTNREMTPYVQSISNPNLLDNPWFTVNQRGVTTYSSDSFGVDRWRCSSMANRKIDVVSDGLKCISTGSGNTAQVMYQGIDALERQLKGKTVTLSCFIKEITPDTSLYMLIRNSNWTSIKAIMISSTGYHSFTIDIPADATDLLYIDFELVNNTAADKYFVIRSIKLELGSVSTLAMDTAPNYQQELAKCQRYFYRANMNIYCTYGIAAAWSTTAARMLYQTPVPMRVRPAITLGDISAFRLINGSTNLPITNAILYGADNTDKFYLELYATTVSGTIYTFNMAATSYIDFSADLL